MQFYYKNVRIRFTFGFFALWAWLAAADPGLAMNMLPACLLHESGHIIAMKLMGIKIDGLTFRCGGISLRAAALWGTSPLKKAVILSAGCIVNIICAVVAGQCLFGYVNMALCLFNLLPFSMLDGGRLIKVIGEAVFPCADMDKAQRICDVFFGTAAVIYFISRFIRGIMLPVTLGIILAECLAEPWLWKD